MSLLLGGILRSGKSDASLIGALFHAIAGHAIHWPIAHFPHFPLETDGGIVYTISVLLLKARDKQITRADGR